MKHSKLNNLFFQFLKKIGIKTAYSRRLEIEKRLQSMFSNTSGIKCRPLNKDCRHIQIVQVRDAADIYNLYMALCKGSTIVCSSLKDGKAEYISEGLTLKSYYVLENDGYISRLMLSGDYQVNGIKEIRFKTVK